MTTRLLADDQSFRVIPIMGMQGMGKTALAKLTFNSKAVVDHFPSRAWPSTAASSTYGDSEQIFNDIVEQLMNHDISGEKDMTKRLEAFLTGQKRCLIVMDDPCDFFFWHHLLGALANTSNGSRMIWITPKMSIPSELKTTNTDPHPLRLRADSESWALFIHALNALNVSMPSQSLSPKLKQRILRTCGGVPLLIVKLAEELSLLSVSQDNDYSTIEEDYWSPALQQLVQKGETFWSSTVCKVHKVLTLSMRRCLFSLTLFPPDYDIPTRRLITLWVAEGYLLMQTEDGARPEDVAKSCLNLLIAQGVVQVANKKLNGNVKTVRLPDELARYWLSKSQQAPSSLGDHHQIHTSSELYPAANNMIRRLVDHLDTNDLTFDHIHSGGHKKTISSASMRQHYQDAISFRSFDTQKRVEPVEYIGEFIKRCISSGCFSSLRVLDLENVFKPKLPEALEELIQLRHLGLRSTFIEKLPSSVGKLGNLQTLDTKHTNISILPDSVWELQQLRHLYLTEVYRRKVLLKSSQSSIGCFATLHTLCGLFLDEGEETGLCSFLNLRKLGLVMSSSQVVKVVTEWVLNLEHLQSLRLKSIGDHDCAAADLELKPLTGLKSLSYIYLFGRLRNPSIASLFPPSLVDLTLSGSELTEDPMQSLDKLPNLKCLKLYAKSYSGKSMICTRGGFPQLRVLKLWKLDQLQEWKVKKGALQALRDLEIRYSSGRPLVVPEELSDRIPFLKIDILQLAL